jgi:hypothetical protein
MSALGCAETGGRHQGLDPGPNDILTLNIINVITNIPVVIAVAVRQLLGGAETGGRRRGP